MTVKSGANGTMCIASAVSNAPAVPTWTTVCPKHEGSAHGLAGDKREETMSFGQPERTLMVENTPQLLMSGHTKLLI